MSSMHESVAIILLAAGTARRFGALKQLQILEGQTLLRRAALTALATGAPVHVVTGADHERVQAELADLPLQQIHNQNWSLGMGQSLACAVRALAGADPAPHAVLVLLADQPLLRAADLQEILRLHLAYPASIIAAEHGADHGAVLGPPCLFPAAFFPALAALDGDRGARGLIQDNRGTVITVPMPHAALDVDTPADLARAVLALRQPGA